MSRIPENPPFFSSGSPEFETSGIFHEKRVRYPHVDGIDSETLLYITGLMVHFTDLQENEVVFVWPGAGHAPDCTDLGQTEPTCVFRLILEDGRTAMCVVHDRQQSSSSVIYRTRIQLSSARLLGD